MKEPNNIQFVTAEKLNVTKRIKEGKTSKFKCRVEAEIFANIKGSYIYDLYFYVVEGPKSTSIKPFGYAVPN